MTRTRLAVVGSPIAHSRSPRLHRAAYAVLGVPFSYDAMEVSASDLTEFVRSRGIDWVGLSLTMPLKHGVVALLDRIDDLGALTRAVNTVRFTDTGIEGFNTDVGGLMQPLLDAGVSSPSRVLVLGAGATAGSAVTAASRLSASSITVAARSVERAATVVELGRRLATNVEVVDLAEVEVWAATRQPDVVINTLPGAAADTLSFSRETRRASVLFDVVYDPWPTTIAASWMDTDGRVIAGIEMLVAQALRQVRVFVGGDPGVALNGEDEVLAAMRASVGLASES